jgi:NADPH:quinone reductase-like Zn-dependent oxidoreductase
LVRAALIRKFGSPSVIEIAEIPRPTPGPREVLVEIRAAGVGPWDALIREGQSSTNPKLPVILGSDLAGVVRDVGSESSAFKPGDEVYGNANTSFTSAYAEFAAAPAATLARKPAKLNFVEAASAPVVAVTAWQMLFDYGHAARGQRVLIHGAGGSVGAYAVQLARDAGLHIVATASADDAAYVRGLGAETVIDFRAARFEENLQPVDLVIDTQGGEVRERSVGVLKEKGMLVSVASPIPDDMARRLGDRAVFFLVEVTTPRLEKISAFFDIGKLVARVGTVLPLSEARAAHEMLAGAPHLPGKIVLQVSG